MRLLPVIGLVSLAGAIYWVFATFELLDIVSWVFIAFSLVVLSLLTLRVLAPKGEKHG